MDLSRISDQFWAATKMAWMNISFTYRSAIDNFLERKKYNFDIEIEMNALPKNLTSLDGESSTITGSKNTNPRPSQKTQIPVNSLPVSLHAEAAWQSPAVTGSKHTYFISRSKSLRHLQIWTEILAVSNMPHDLNSYRFCPIAWYLLNPRHYLLYIHLAKEKNLYENVDEKKKYLDAGILKNPSIWAINSWKAVLNPVRLFL